jgi:hypothetical protein
MGLVEHNASFTFDVNSMTGRPKFIVRHSTPAKLPCRRVVEGSD